MTQVALNESPKVGDRVYFELTTRSVSGTLLTPFTLDLVTVYFLARSVTEGAVAADAGSLPANAVPVRVYGGGDTPAWEAANPEDALVTRIEIDADGNATAGRFGVVFPTEFCREGDYFVTWTWTPLSGATPLSDNLGFYLAANVAATTNNPSHVTAPGKYELLMGRYLPDMFNSAISESDRTPDVVARLNAAVAAGFTGLEDQTNQLLDLLDANVLHEALLPYLANLMNWRLKTNSASLWRRQIKEAIPLYKRKGTLGGLQAAMQHAAIRLNRITRYWQIVSKSTWQESFRVETDGQTEFPLQKVPLTVDTENFELNLLGADGQRAADLPLENVVFTVADGAATMTWVGPDDLLKNDIVTILYKVKAVTDQSEEDYVRSLPAADNRDDELMRDLDITFPRRNLNVRLIADDDPMLPVLCPTRHPFHDAVVFGQVRTEFPYSENIYNMDEYEGCCVGKTLLQTENGIKPIKDVLVSELVLTEFGMRKHEGVKNQGLRETVVLSTKMGRELQITKNHKFKVMSNTGLLEWKMASELVRGDYVLGKRGNTPTSESNHHDNWYLAGYAYGDGYLYKQVVHWLVPEGDNELLVKIQDILKENCSKYRLWERTKEKHQPHTHVACNKSMWIISTSRLQSPVLGSILPAHEPKGRWKEHVPSSLWGATQADQCSFLRGLFDADGSVQNGKAVLTTKWVTLAREIQEILLGLGILSTVTSYPVVYKDQVNTYYRVNVIGKKGLQDYIKLIGFSSSKKMKALCGNFCSTNVNRKQPTILCSDRTVIPYADEIARNVFPSKKWLSELKVQDRSKNEKQTINLIARLKQSYVTVIPDNRVADLLAKAMERGVDCQHRKFLNDYVENNWFFDKVVSVLPGEVCEVFDPVDVSKTHSYVSNGLISHNSTRNSSSPCDIDKNFSDSCPCCLSSMISLDVELERLSNDRMAECSEVLREFLPFHAVIHSVNFDGGVQDYVLPPVETIEVYITSEQKDYVLGGQMLVNRTIQPWTENLRRGMLATANNLVTASDGVGRNPRVSLYSPTGSLSAGDIGLHPDENELEILSGVNAGVYGVVPAPGGAIDFADPETVPDPFNKTTFPFRLSNVVYVGGGSVFQADRFLFRDAAVALHEQNVVYKKDTSACWKVVVLSGPSAGTYDIQAATPDGALVLLGWPGTVAATNLAYELRTNAGVAKLASGTGAVAVERRGRFDATTSLVAQHGARAGDFFSAGSAQYPILEFLDDDSCYVAGWTAGNAVGLPAARIYRRLIDGGVGQVQLNDMVLMTNINYYSLLGVSDSAENDQHRENFLVLIGTDYYQISNWTTTENSDDLYEIWLVGTPLQEWGPDQEPGVSFSIIQFLKTTPVSVTTTFPMLQTSTITKLDRRGGDLGTSSQTTAAALTASAAAVVLNADRSGSPMEVVSQGENITILIEEVE